MIEIILLIVGWLAIITVVSYILANLYWIYWGDTSEYDKLPDEEDIDE